MRWRKGPPCPLSLVRSMNLKLFRGAVIILILSLHYTHVHSAYHIQYDDLSGTDNCVVGCELLVVGNIRISLLFTSLAKFMFGTCCHMLWIKIRKTSWSCCQRASREGGRIALCGQMPDGWRSYTTVSVILFLDNGSEGLSIVDALRRMRALHRGIFNLGMRVPRCLPLQSSSLPFW